MHLLFYLHIFHLIFQKKHKPLTILHGSDYCYNKTKKYTYAVFLPGTENMFCSLTLFAGLTVRGSTRGSWRRWGGGGGHSMRLVPVLRTTFRGLDAFDSPGMAVSFVVGLCLALQEKAENIIMFML